MEVEYYILWGFLGFIMLFTIRMLVVIIVTCNGRRTKIKRSSQDKIKTLIVIGSGGHTSEMMYLVESLDPNRYSPRLYVMADSDTWSEQKIHEHENKLKVKNTDTKYYVCKIPRSRSVHQSYFTSIFTTLYSGLASIPVMSTFNPDLILCNGPGTCIPICVNALFMRCCYYSDNKIIFIESICRVKSLSLSGKILQYFADELLVQWPELTTKCRRAKYIGRVA